MVSIVGELDGFRNKARSSVNFSKGDGSVIFYKTF